MLIVLQQSVPGVAKVASYSFRNVLRQQRGNFSKYNTKNASKDRKQSTRNSKMLL